ADLPQRRLPREASARRRADRHGAAVGALAFQVDEHRQGTHPAPAVGVLGVNQEGQRLELQHPRLVLVVLRLHLEAQQPRRPASRSAHAMTRQATAAVPTTHAQCPRPSGSSWKKLAANGTYMIATYTTIPPTGSQRNSRSPAGSASSPSRRARHRLT